ACSARSEGSRGEARDCEIASPVNAAAPSGVAENIAVLPHDVRCRLAMLKGFAPKCRQRARVKGGDDGIVDVSERRAPREKGAIRKLDVLAAQKRFVEHAERCERVETCDHVRTYRLRTRELAERTPLGEKPLRAPVHTRL